MSIDIRNFVNVNIDRNVQLVLNGSRPTVRLYSANYEGTLIGSNSNQTLFYVSENSSVDPIILDNETDLQFAKIFFANGGCKLEMTKSALPTNVAGFANIPDDIIVLASEATLTEEQLNSLVSNLKDLEGVHQKIFVNRVTSTNFIKSSSFIVTKYSEITGAEMAIGAYFSQISFYEDGSPVDYDFTKETITDKNGNHDTLGAKLSFTSPETMITNSFNFEAHISESYYNVGGNTTDGNDAVEQLGMIIMEQDLSTNVFKTLSTKISGQKGIAAIRTTIAETLTKFVDSGFLITNRVWTSNDLVLANKADSSKSKETVITKNTPISNGYYIHMFRLSSDLRKVYAAIILATNKGIRYVIIDGKSF